MEIRRITDAIDEIRIMKVLDDALPIRLFDRDNCDEIVKRMTENAIFFVAFDDYKEGPLGYIAFYANDHVTNMAYITSICVRESFQGIGVGSKLLETALNEAKRQGMSTMKLEVLKSNEKAIRFYISKGFRQSSDDLNGSLYMEKCLR
ncbi:Acetyltransferase (GNAT) domain-containing protein [Lachnospiraceae bacterium XBB2008]|nr:Acetyltransferase (GNAT) domain-containing protein [Lachnospiraceae bacterium XBB2008]